MLNDISNDNNVITLANLKMTSQCITGSNLHNYKYNIQLLSSNIT